MKGDVKGAFRHLMVSAACVRWLATSIPQLHALIIDMSAPFGWISSPTYYGVFGGAITWLVGRESPASLDPVTSDSEPFFAYEWVDDHVLVEYDQPHRTSLANAALRLAMMAVFGPRVVNEKNFSGWSTELEVLGLLFDTIKRLVSMPDSKIDKAVSRVEQMLGAQRTTKTDVQKLLGSLRHICTCCRAVRPFFHRAQGLCNVTPARGLVAIPKDVKQDLQWYRAILRMGQLEDLPTSMFGDWPLADIHLYMDASNQDLAVLDPSTRSASKSSSTAENKP